MTESSRSAQRGRAYNKKHDVTVYIDSAMTSFIDIFIVGNTLDCFVFFKTKYSISIANLY